MFWIGLSKEFEMLTVMLILAVTAFICAILSAMGKIPLWIAVMILCVIALASVIPFK